jgi:hypothetical protein
MHHLIESMDLMLVSTIGKQGGLLKLYKATRRSPWPASMSDFVPDGGASLHNLIRWLPQMDVQLDHGMLICNVFEAMPSHLRAGFMKSSILVDWLHHTITAWTMQPIDVDADLPTAMESSNQRVIYLRTRSSSGCPAALVTASTTCSRRLTARSLG